MRLSLLILPILSLLVFVSGLALRSTFVTIPWISYLGTTLACALLTLWIWLDRERMREFLLRRGTRYGAASGATLALGLLVIAGICVLANRPRFNISSDWTGWKGNTLSAYTSKLLEHVATLESIKVTAYFKDAPVEQGFRSLIDLYRENGAQFAIEYLDPDIDVLRAKADQLQSGNSVIFKLADRRTVITVFNEEAITNALQKILKETETTLCFSQGQGEPAIGDDGPMGLKTVVQTLQDNRFRVIPATLASAELERRCDALVIIGPRFNFPEPAIRVLDAYLGQGGRVLVMADAMQPVATLNQILNQHGLGFNADFLALTSDDPRAKALGQNACIVNDFDAVHPATAGFAKRTTVVISDCRSLSLNDGNTHAFKVEALAKVASDTVRVRDVHTVEDLSKITQEKVERGAYPFVAHAYGNIPKSQRTTHLIVVGSAHLALNQSFSNGAQPALFLNLVNYIADDQHYIALPAREEGREVLTLTSTTSVFALAGISFIYPFLFLGAGIWMALRRRRV